jgi:RNA polymerase primary sigma factor
MRRVATKMQEVLGREPTDEELAHQLDIPVSRVTQMRTVSIRPTSLDAPIGDDDSNNYSEIIADETASTP